MHNTFAPSELTIARFTSATISTATTVAVNANTSILEVKCTGQAVYFRYNTGVTNANFDEVIIPGETMIRKMDQGEYANISVLEVAPTATVYITQK